MDIEDAKRITKLNGREYPNARFEFMRCQLGVYNLVAQKIGAYKTVAEKVFTLQFFGETWDDAVDSWQLAKKQKDL